VNVTSTTIIEGDPPQSIPGRWRISSPVGAPPLRFFRRAACLRFETGERADRIGIVGPESTTLKAVFGPLDYDALGQIKTPLKASLADSGETVIVELEAPRQVRRVGLRSSAASGSGRSIEFYRLDGDTPADKPTISVGVLNNEATLPSDADFTDARFAMRLAGASGPLRAGDLAELRVRGYPTGPRLGIADPKDAASAVFFWQVAGEVGKMPPADQGNVDAGQAFVDALQRYLDDFFARPAGSTGPAPEFVEAALIAASDAPCVLDVTAFDVTYHLVLQSLHSGGVEQAGKQVLRFAGGSEAVQEVSVRLPGNATVASATLETAESFRDDRLLASDDGSPDVTLAQKEGVYVGVERWASQEVTRAQAVSVSGIAVALMAITDAAEMLVELHEDWRGQPSGRKLASGALTLGRAGERGWVTLPFPEPVVLSSDPYWILIKAADGRAVWLAEAGDPPVRVLEGNDEPGTWADLNALDGLHAMHRFLSRGEQAQEQAPVSLAIGEQVVVGTIDEDSGTKVYDLASAINDHLGGSPSYETIPLTFRSVLSGLITVYPPVVEFDPS